MRLKVSTILVKPDKRNVAFILGAYLGIRSMPLQANGKVPLDISPLLKDCTAGRGEEARVCSRCWDGGDGEAIFYD